MAEYNLTWLRTLYNHRNVISLYLFLFVSDSSTHAYKSFCTCSTKIKIITTNSAPLGRLMSGIEVGYADDNDET